MSRITSRATNPIILDSFHHDKIVSITVPKPKVIPANKNIPDTKHFAKNAIADHHTATPKITSIRHNEITKRLTNIVNIRQMMPIINLLSRA